MCFVKGKIIRVIAWGECLLLTRVAVMAKDECLGGGGGWAANIGSLRGRRLRTEAERMPACEKYPGSRSASSVYWGGITWIGVCWLTTKSRRRKMR